MSIDPRCEQMMLEISVAHDEGREPNPLTRDHLSECEVCSRFAEDIDKLDGLLAAGRYERAPDIASTVLERLARPRSQWWSIAAVALVGLLAGALVGGVGARLDRGEARDLSELFHSAGTDLEGLTADLLVVERGLHPDVPERVYTGLLTYEAPESLSIELVDTTVYPNTDWIPNDVQFVTTDGDMLAIAGAPCPVAALPGCLVEPMRSALRDQPPFDDGILIPLEIVGPGRSLTWPSAIDVLGTTTLQGRPAVQVRSTVAAVELIGAVTERGAWRDLHPTDEVLMWLDETTLVPLRIEVFASDSPERELWQLRRGYRDVLGDEQPIFIIELSQSVAEAGQISLDLPDDTRSRGFVDGATEIPEPELPPGFESHRTGHRVLGDGGQVEVASWSDGRSWLMVEMTGDWEEPRLFGLSQPFVDRIDVGEGSVGYLSPTADSIAVHGDKMDIVVSGSVPQETLLEAASSLGVDGVEVPANWLEASTVSSRQLPAGTLVPVVEDWSILGRPENGVTTILLSGGGARSIIVTQQQASRLPAPTGPDFSETPVRGFTGRYDISAGILEWVEDGRLIRMQSETVGMEVLVQLAETMEPR